MKTLVGIVGSVVCVVLLLPSVSAAQGQTVLVEAESFEDLGGWVVDQQFADQMGSPFLLAHGLGKPVKDATAIVRFQETGKHKVWVRTRDWAAPWLGGISWPDRKYKPTDAPGRFQLLINGKPLNAVFGTEGAKWHWQYGGTIEITEKHLAISLHDLTGFDGRCDAIVFTTDTDFIPPNEAEQLAAFRKKMLGLPDEPEDAGQFDLVVVGGGMAGTCTAISAARLGCRVALIQNRPVLGGNNSSEVRVHLGGKINLPPYPALGDVVAELDSGYHGNARPASYYDDQKKLRVVNAEKNIHLFVNMHAFKAEKEGDRITAVVAKHIRSSKEMRFGAKLFADCTGDGAIGYLAGADFRMGRESRAETGESLAPEKADKMTMGASVQWYSRQTDESASFPDCPWALQFNEQSCHYLTRGDWNWETGLNRDQINEFEYIRDYALRAAFGNWAYLKNKSNKTSDYADRKLDWVAYVAGKRESRRLLGDVILQQQDIEGRKKFPDAFVTTTWTIDLHYPDPKNTKYFPGAEFRSIAKHLRISPYPIPYRCFYSRNIDNLFMAGRDISVTHVALGTVRVMRTCGMMGELVGMAASLCKKHDTTPRGVYKNHLDELKQLAKQGVGKRITKDDPAFNQAAENGRLANEGFIRCRNFVAGWLKHADPKTGLIPRNLSRDKDIWNAKDSAADNYPFMVLTAAITDRSLFEGRMLDMLRTETKLTSRIGAMPDTYSFSKQGFQSDQPDLGRIIFGSSEYIKDGLLPLTEWLGPSPWSQRMLNILDNIWKHAPVDTKYGKIPSTSQEINGEMLQTLSRIYWMTGNKEYLDCAIRLGDYYLLGEHHPTHAYAPAKGQWLTLDVANPQQIARADIAWIYGDRRVYLFNIEVSDDRQTWKKVFDGKSSGKSADMESYKFPKASARYVRINGFGNSENDWTNIAELALYGPQPDADKLKIKSATASGHQVPNKPSNVIDGDLGTRWSVGTGGSQPKLRLDDHGCEIVSGLCELYAMVNFAEPDKKRAYQEPIHKMLDRILEVGRDEHGLFYNWADPATGAHDNGRTDNWGYNLNGFYTVHLIDKTPHYRQAVVKALKSLNVHYKGYKWEGGGADGYADSIEGAINLYNREPVASAAEWIDREIKVMWAIQKEDGVIEGWHGDGNFARTTIMYCLWKTKGLTIRPWRQDVIFGAATDTDSLKITIRADKAWTGKILFDTPRHKTIMNMPLDWPRINQFPEWFTAKAEKRYTVLDLTANTQTTHTGKQLTEGITINLQPNTEKHLLVQ